MSNSIFTTVPTSMSQKLVFSLVTIRVVVFTSLPVLMLTRAIAITTACYTDFGSLVTLSAPGGDLEYYSKIGEQEDENGNRYQ